MLPIQTFLVLLALLMAVGCSQKAPPVAGGKNATQTLPKNVNTHIQDGQTNNNGQGTNNGNNGNTNTNDTAKGSETPLPSVEAGKTVAKLDEDGRWLLHIDGEGAQKLFEATAVAETAGKKTGLQYECVHVQSSYRCTVIVSAADGSVKNLITKDELKKADATFKPEKDYISNPNFVTIKAGGAMATLDIEGATGEKLFNTMTTTLKQEDLAAAKLFGNDYDTGLLKYGTNVMCYMRPLKSDPNKKHYWCYIYLNPDSGMVQLISLPK